jgi:hypothetical protein
MMTNELHPVIFDDMEYSKTRMETTKEKGCRSIHQIFGRGKDASGMQCYLSTLNADTLTPEKASTDTEY